MTIECKQVRYAREPDITGPGGSAWQINPPPGGPPDWQGSIAGWILHVPNAHPFWAWWDVASVHLRPIEGVRPAVKHYPEAEFEFMIITLNPEEPLPEIDGRPNGAPLKVLVPADVCTQFHGVTDDQAARITRDAVVAICNGRMSPDQDFRRVWEQAIAATVAHYRTGAHEPH